MRIAKTLIMLATGLSLVAAPTLAAAQAEAEEAHGPSDTILLALGIAGVAGFIYAVVKDNESPDSP